MWSIAIDANYKKVQPSSLNVGVAQTALPAVNTTVVKPEKIFVQAHPSNTDLIWVGLTGVASDGSAGGYPLAAGGNMVLPGHMVADWFAIAPIVGQKLLVTYLAGVY